MHDDGRSICTEIKQNALTKNIPVILCSGQAEKLVDFRDWLADDIIQKPLELNKVFSKISGFLK